MANLSNINNKFLVTTTGEVLIGQTSNNGNRLQITGADGASYIYLKTDVATTGGRIGFNGDDLRVFNQQASGELQLGTAGTSRVRISNSLVVFPTITELRGDVAAKFAIGNMGGASSQMMVSSRGFLTLNVSNTGSALDATERMRIDSSGNTTFTSTSPELTIKSNNGAVGSGTSIGKLSWYTSDATTPTGAGNVTTMETKSTTSNGSDYAFIINKREGSGGGSCYMNLGGNSDGSITFGTNTSGAGTERMRITSGGMVGIGMTPSTVGSSTYVLQMYNPGSQCFLSLGNGTSGNGPLNGLVIGNDASNAYIVNREATSLIFATSDANRMTILAGGNVGIGDTNPSFILDTNITSSRARFKANTGDANIELSSIAGHDWLIQSKSDSSFAIYDEDAAAERMRITSGGTVLFGKTVTSTDTIGFRIDGAVSTLGRVFASILNSQFTYYVRDTQNAAYRFYVSGTGQIYATSTSISSLSDVTLKENIKPLETGLDEVMKLQPRRFDWKNGDGENIAGFVAQEVEEVLPDLVSDYEYDDGVTKKSLKTGDMIPTLVKAIQELKAEIELLKSK